jgi:Uma2 family endonuclease
MSMMKAELSHQVAQWNHEAELGIVFGSSAGFTVPNRAVLSPDTSWMPRGRWQTISPADQQRFAHVCPDFVVELLSLTDRLTDTMRKMEHWLEAGARLGRLFAPGTESVYIFEPGQPVRPVVGFDQNLTAGPVLPNFALELRRLRMKE